MPRKIRVIREYAHGYKDAVSFFKFVARENDWTLLKVRTIERKDPGLASGVYEGVFNTHGRPDTL